MSDGLIPSLPLLLQDGRLHLDVHLRVRHRVHGLSNNSNKNNTTDTTITTTTTTTNNNNNHTNTSTNTIILLILLIILLILLIMKNNNKCKHDDNNHDDNNNNNNDDFKNDRLALVCGRATWRRAPAGRKLDASSIVTIILIIQLIIS